MRFAGMNFLEIGLFFAIGIRLEISPLGATVDLEQIMKFR
jgi:hypothetical protein